MPGALPAAAEEQVAQPSEAGWSGFHLWALGTRCMGWFQQRWQFGHLVLSLDIAQARQESSAQIVREHVQGPKYPEHWTLNLIITKKLIKSCRYVYTYIHIYV